jgi:hypothetical protein
MTYYVMHPHHNGVAQVEAGSPQEAARIAVERDKQKAIWGELTHLAAQIDAGVKLTVYWGDVDAHGSVPVTV